MLYLGQARRLLFCLVTAPLIEPNFRPRGDVFYLLPSVAPRLCLRRLTVWSFWEGFFAPEYVALVERCYIIGTDFAHARKVSERRGGMMVGPGIRAGTPESELMQEGGEEFRGETDSPWNTTWMMQTRGAFLVDGTTGLHVFRPKISPTFVSWYGACLLEDYASSCSAYLKFMFHAQIRPDTERSVRIPLSSSQVAATRAAWIYFNSSIDQV
ncbi:hypothetical protein C8R44DRAFT_738548 [Mycena epipterygia]|nr:hypothetical protein C8R44DRAFT_738548 [Mycena epipterygia]